MKGLIILMLALGAALLVACGGQSGSTVMSMAEFDLAATDIAYDNDRFEVTVGQPVKVELENDGALVHDFSIMEIPHSGEVMSEEMEEDADHDMSNMEMEPEVHVAAEPGTTHSVEFTPTEAGEYEFFCTVEGHKQAGMVGTLVVKDA